MFFPVWSRLRNEKGNARILSQAPRARPPATRPEPSP